MNIIWSVKNLLLGGTKDLLPNEHWLIAQAIQFLPEQVSAVLKNEVHNISWVQRHNGNRIVHIFLNKKITNLITKFDLPCDEYYVACVEHMVGKKIDHLRLALTKDCFVLLNLEGILISKI